MVDQAFRDAAYPQETGDGVVVLLTIEHDALPAPLLWNDGGTDIVYATDLTDAGGNVAALAGTYLAFPIEVVPPGQSDEQPRGTIRVPNVDQAIGAAIASITDPAVVTVTVVLLSDPTVIVGGPHRGLELNNARGDAIAVEAELSWQSLTADVWPKDWLRPSAFKAAFRL